MEKSVEFVLALDTINKYKMNKQKINEDFLLLLVEKNRLVETTEVSIDNLFECETQSIRRICEGDDDNILQITQYIKNTIKPKIPNKIFNYCKELDKAYQSVYVNVESSIQDILRSREMIFANERLTKEDNKEFNLKEEIRNLKNQIRERIELWFKIFNIEFAYDKAKVVPNMLVYSHRISGWSNPEYKITDNLKLQIKTNFGYGSVSYFYSLLTFKNIQITPLSEWIDYRYSNFAEVNRYTRSFCSKIERYHKTKIENSYWFNAIEFTKDAANLSITNEQEFIDEFIISECESMVNGLEVFYKENEFYFIDEKDFSLENKKNRYRVNINGYELIDFRTEKIIGALDFISKINDYNTIIPTTEYTQRIISINKTFIPNVYIALETQKAELNTVNKDYNEFIISHNELLQKQNFYKNERNRLKNNFNTQYKEEYSEFHKILTKSFDKLKHLKYKIKLHSDNINKLIVYINKYKEIIKE